MLEEVQTQLNEAKADKSESTRTQKKQEFIDNLKRLYPGVYGRLVDLCEPVHKRYILICFFFLVTVLLRLNPPFSKFSK